jgi:hypothetical protein
MHTQDFLVVRRRVVGGVRVHADNGQTERTVALLACVIQPVLKRLERTILRLTRIGLDLDDGVAEQPHEGRGPVVTATGTRRVAARVGHD